MNKSQYQNIWDEQMVGCWRADASMASLVARFLDAADLGDSYDYTRDEPEDLFTMLESIGLRRWRYNKAKGMAFRMKVRAHVAEHSRQLSSCMMDPKMVDSTILDMMPAFKWTLPKCKREPRLEPNPGVPSIHYGVKARSLDGSGWGTVR